MSGKPRRYRGKGAAPGFKWGCKPGQGAVVKRKQGQEWTDFRNRRVRSPFETVILMIPIQNWQAFLLATFSKLRIVCTLLWPTTCALLHVGYHLNP